MRIKTTNLFTLALAAFLAWPAGAAVLADDEVFDTVAEAKSNRVSDEGSGEMKTWSSDDGDVIMVTGDCTVETIEGDGEKVMVKMAGCGDGDVHKVIRVDGEPVKRTFLGVGLSSLTPELRVHFGSSEEIGIMVASVVEGSPAEAAGLQVGDIITSVNGVSATSVHEAQKAVYEMNEGDTALVEVLRDGQPMSFEALLTTREFPGFGNFDFDFDFNFDNILEGVEGARRCIIKLGDGDGNFYIDTDNLDEAMEKLNEHLNSPEFQESLEKLEAEGEIIEKRIAILEKKVEEME